MASGIQWRSLYDAPPISLAALHSFSYAVAALPKLNAGVVTFLGWQLGYRAGMQPPGHGCCAHQETRGSAWAMRTASAHAAAFFTIHPDFGSFGPQERLAAEVRAMGKASRARGPSPPPGAEQPADASAAHAEVRAILFGSLMCNLKFGAFNGLLRYTVQYGSEALAYQLGYHETVQASVH